ncbi:DUF7919 family protein [Streptomyces griseicoloratus]|uniref:DUF7919 family protein n=1 Tax=Streptomyces griseicoloratus TaxID=2752516 RepID=UPI004038E576
MPYYADLSPYTYDSSDQNALSVGWLDSDHPYPTGPTPDGLVSALVQHANHPVNVHRGMHFCNLCPDFQTARSNISRGNHFIGSGEIHIKGRDGRVYAAPLMIIHYLEAHRYLPPEEFCAAALGADRPDGTDN